MTTKELIQAQLWWDRFNVDLYQKILEIKEKNNESN